MSDTMYYEKPVLLDRDKHRNRRVKPSKSFAFASRANSMYLAGAEFNEACKEYAIVFTRDAEKKIVPVAVLGWRNRENLFVDDGERWTAGYVPAFVRRYPFVLAQLQGDSLGLCMDDAYPGLHGEEGEPLFDAQGGNTPFLQNAIDFLTRYQKEFRRTADFCARVEQAGLFKEMNAKADLVDGRSFSINGLLVVDEQKLKELPDAVALSLFRSGELHLISLHLASLSNMQKLVDRMAARQSPPQAAPKPGTPGSATP